jgi:phosphatidylinositol glycan class M
MFLRAVAAFRERITLRILLLVSLVFRLALLLYGEWQDSRFAVKFTDIDYHVFSDASRHVIHGDSPFLRATYRYTPLLAFMLVPNHLLFFSFGKTLFIFCDLLVGFIINEILRLKGVKRHSRLLSVSVWLLNPLTATVSARGNAESFLAVLVLLSLLCLLRGRVTLSAVSYGAAVHVKIFPAIYSLPILLYLQDRDNPTPRGSCNEPLFKPSGSVVSLLKWIRGFPNVHQLRYVVVSTAVFFSLTGIFYLLYGSEFVHEAYLYHVTRRDIKHNFSPYFYLLYLIQGTGLSLPVGLLAFLPQVGLLLAAAISLHRDIVFCCFVQTFVFVTFNKVCTSQYFLWYLCLLPLVLPFSNMGLRQWTAITTLWFTGQVRMCTMRENLFFNYIHVGHAVCNVDSYFLKPSILKV